MNLELDIDRLAVPGLSVHARDQLAAVIERELGRLVSTTGLPFGRDVGELDVEAARLEVRPGGSVREVGAGIARQLLAGIHREATGRVPHELRDRDE